MKKMSHPIIITLLFIVVLSLLVFAGCKAFSGDKGDTTLEEIESTIEAAENSSSEYETVIETETDASGEAVTDESGEAVTVVKEVTTAQNTNTEKATSAAENATGASGKKNSNSKTNTETKANTNNSGKTNTNTETKANTNNSGKTNTNTNTNTNSNTNTNTTTGKTDFDIITSGTFDLSGSVKDTDGSVTPLEIARTPSSVYMLSSIDGVSMGALIADEKTYMICPSKKCYLEITSSMLKLMDMDMDELVDASQYSFSDLGKLSDAVSTTTENFNGTSCTAYKFNKSDTSIITFYMNGTKLLGFTSANSDGSSPATVTVTSISSNVASEKQAPSSDYKAYKGIVGAARFAAAVGISDE